MVSKNVGGFIFIIGLVVLVAGLSMSSTSTITGSTDVPESCVESDFGDSCYGGGEINSETTVTNPTKGPTMVGGFVLSIIGLGLVMTGSSSEEPESEAKHDGVPMDEKRSSQSVNTDGGSTTEQNVGANQRPSREANDMRQSAESDRRETNVNAQSSGNSDATQTIVVLKEYRDEIKFYGSIIGGAIVTYWIISFLFGPTFVMNGFIGRVVTLLSLVGGGYLGYQFHERRFGDSDGSETSLSDLW